jgi:CheY-like chemotaxis protein
MRAVYSKLGRLDYLVDSPKSIMSFENGVFKFLFVNKQYEEQLLSLGFSNVKEVEDASNDPANPVYYTLHEAEKAAYNAPCEITYVTHGTYVYMKGSLIADVNGCRIYDLTLRNTHVSAFNGSSDEKNELLPVGKKTILLAETNLQNRAFLESVLRKDYNILLAGDGKQVLDLLLKHGDSISLALINVDLPKMDGFKIIQKFQAERRSLQIPFVVMTDNMDLAKESIRVGASQFLLTPVNDGDMIKAKIDGSIKNAETLRRVSLNYMEYVPGGIVLFSVKSGEILYVNARVLDMFECANTDEFQRHVGRYFKNAILPEDYGKVNADISEQVTSRSTATKQLTFRAKTASGKVKRIYHVGKVFSRTPYGIIFSVFMSEDDVAMKSYFKRKEAFANFMASGEATGTKSYDPGYRGFLFWNLTKNSPVIRMGGISYIPKELEDKYTYEIHYKYLSSLMLQNESNVMNALDYTRDKLILDYMNKCKVHSLDISYDVVGYSFTIRSSFDMMMDPDTGDIILKLQNESIKTTKNS